MESKRVVKILFSSVALLSFLGTQEVVRAQAAETDQIIEETIPEGSVHTVVNEEGKTETENTGNYYDETADPLNLQAEGNIVSDEKVPEEERVVSGEVHNHTSQSNDAGEPYNNLENSLDTAFREEDKDVPAEGMSTASEGEAFDYLMTSEHLRWSPRNVEGEETDKKATWESVKSEIEKYNQLKTEGKYAGKLYYPGFEWDMFGLDHATMAILDTDETRVPLEAYRQFEWLYAYDTETELFKNNELATYGPRDNEKADKTNSYDGLRWLQTHYPNSMLQINHPSRHNGGDGEVRIEDIRKMQDIAPSVVYGIEGMPGNQLGGDRGETTEIYGGTDIMVAKLGGIWDALLAEGRPLYNYANSDFHFKISKNELYSSGYWPSEYSRNYTVVSGDTFHDISKGLKNGNSWSVYGDLISGLDYYVEVDGKKVQMGESLAVEEPELANLVIRFKETEKNNYQPLFAGYESTITNQPILDHIDLIVGNIYGKVVDQTQNENPTTRLAKTWTAADWGTADAEGWYTLNIPFMLNQDMYLRLRGTNHQANTPGETDAMGNPLQDPVMEKPQEEAFDNEADYLAALKTFFNQVNERNYSDLWFYSNPIRLLVADGKVTVPERFVSEVSDLIGEDKAITGIMTDLFDLPESTLTQSTPEKAEVTDEQEATQTTKTAVQRTIIAVTKTIAKTNSIVTAKENLNEEKQTAKMNEKVAANQSASLPATGKLASLWSILLGGLSILGGLFIKETKH